MFLDIQIGYLHRGTEKLIEFKNVAQALPYFDRLDYVSVVHNEHAFILSLEYLLHLSLLMKVSIARVLMLELTRCLNGFLAISCSTLDLGSMSPMLWSFEERDKLLSIFDLICGVRMHVAFICLGGVLDDVTMLYDVITASIESSLVICDSLDLLFVNNRIIYVRLRGVALMDWSDIQFNSISGVLLRSVGICWDLRFILMYEIYRCISISFTYAILGDAFDRFVLRLFEIKQGLLIAKDVMVELI